MDKEKIMQVQYRFFRAGKLTEARRVLRLLITGTMNLGMGDSDWMIQRELNSMGIDGQSRHYGRILHFSYNNGK